MHRDLALDGARAALLGAAHEGERLLGRRRDVEEHAAVLARKAVPRLECARAQLLLAQRCRGAPRLPGVALGHACPRHLVEGLLCVSGRGVAHLVGHLVLVGALARLAVVEWGRSRRSRVRSAHVRAWACTCTCTCTAAAAARRRGPGSVAKRRRAFVDELVDRVLDGSKRLENLVATRHGRAKGAGQWGGH